MGEIPYTGHLKLGHNVAIGYYAQNQAQLLDENLTVFDTIDSVAKGDIRLKIRDILGAFMFGGEASTKKVKVLSGGERTRLALLKLLLEPYNLLILDEPTNHLDFGNQLRTVNRIGELTKKGYAVVMTTHMPDHAMRLGGLTAILIRRGEFLCGSADEVITEENLRDIYQTDIRIVYVPEAGYRICVFARKSS